MSLIFDPTVLVTATGAEIAAVYAKWNAAFAETPEAFCDHTEATPEMQAAYFIQLLIEVRS